MSGLVFDRPLSSQMLSNMKKQFAEHLCSAGFVDSPNPKDYNANCNSGGI